MIPSNTWLKVGFELVEEIFLKDSKPLNELNEKEMCELWCVNNEGRSQYLHIRFIIVEIAKNMAGGPCSQAI